jgi:hypothetical protein
MLLLLLLLSGGEVLLLLLLLAWRCCVVSVACHWPTACPYSRKQMHVQDHDDE